jgi:uncharacterized protein (TIGR03067 family)
MKNIATALAIFLAAISFTRAADTDAAKKDIAQLQGEWTMVSASADGQEMPAQMRQQMKRICKGNVTTTTMAGQVYLKATFAVDPSKTPKTIDYHMTDGFAKGQKQLGIYEINGDTFKACFAKPGAARPADFQGGVGVTMSVWKRAKAASP